MSKQLTMQDMADILGVSRTHVYKLLAPDNTTRIYRRTADQLIEALERAKMHKAAAVMAEYDQYIAAIREAVKDDETA